MIYRILRRIFLETHLWLGIASGIILFIVCLSGTILVFQDEFRYFAEPTRYSVNVSEGQTRLPVDELIAKVEAELYQRAVRNFSANELLTTVSARMQSQTDWDFSVEAMNAIVEAELPKRAQKVASITIPEQPNRTITMTLAVPGQSGMGPGGPGGPGRGMRQGSPGGRGGMRQGGGGGEMGQGARGQRPEGGRPEGMGRPERTGETPDDDSETTLAGSGQQRPPSGQQRPQGGGGRRGNAVHVNPYTGEIVGEGTNVADPFFMSMMRLHRFFWMSGEWQPVGKQIVGWATIIFGVLCLSGLVLWLPKTLGSFLRWGSWRVGLRVRFNKGGLALLYDLHNTVGFYLLIPALILALTGLCWSFAWYRNGVSHLLGDQVFGARMQQPAVIEPVDESVKPLSVDEMIARKNELLPGPGDISVSIPTNRESAMVIRKGRTGFFTLNIPDRSQWDPFRGTVIPVEFFGQTVEVERFSDRPLGSKIAVSIRGLHFGDITGMSSKIFFFTVCLFATTLPITGTLWWIKKLRTKYKRRRIQSIKSRATLSPSGFVQIEPMFFRFMIFSLERPS